MREERGAKHDEVHFYALKPLEVAIMQFTSASGSGFRGGGGDGREAQ